MKPYDWSDWEQYEFDDSGTWREPTTLDIIMWTNRYDFLFTLHEIRSRPETEERS